MGVVEQATVLFDEGDACFAWRRRGYLLRKIISMAGDAVDACQIGLESGLRMNLKVGGSTAISQTQKLSRHSLRHGWRYQKIGYSQASP